LIQEHPNTAAPGAARSSRSEEREWFRKQARVQRELAAVQRRWARSLSQGPPDRVAPTGDDARRRAR
jgi:hypothetical protein